MATATKTKAPGTKAPKTKVKATPKVKGLELVSLSPASAEIERMIEYFREDMGFNSIRITPIIQTQGQRKCYAHFTTDARWARTDGQKGSHEIQVSAESLARPATEIAATVLHELVHAKNCDSGITDCSNGGTYHNAKFKATAEQYGLQCLEKTSINGHGLTALSPVMEARIIAELQPNDKVFTMYRLTVPKGKSKSKMRKWECGCMVIRAAKEVTAVCTACDEPFVEAD